MWPFSRTKPPDKLDFVNETIRQAHQEPRKPKVCPACGDYSDDRDMGGICRKCMEYRDEDFQPGSDFEKLCRKHGFESFPPQAKTFWLNSYRVYEVKYQRHEITLETFQKRVEEYFQEVRDARAQAARNQARLRAQDEERAKLVKDLL